MNGVFIEWIDLIPLFFYIRVLIGALGFYWLVDTAFMVGFVDGPKTKHCFKFMAMWLSASAMGLILFSWMNEPLWMFISLVSTVFALSLMRLWTWIKGLHLSKFVMGETIHMRNK